MPTVLRNLLIRDRNEVEGDIRSAQRLDAELWVADDPTPQHGLPEPGDEAWVLAVDDDRTNHGGLGHAGSVRLAPLSASRRFLRSPPPRCCYTGECRSGQGVGTHPV